MCHENERNSYKTSQTEKLHRREILERGRILQRKNGIGSNDAEFKRVRQSALHVIRPYDFITRGKLLHFWSH
jgi:hypothetical protein